MPKTNYTRTNSADGFPGGVDLGDLYVPKDYFLEGGLWSWGYNGYGALGDGTRVRKSSPVQTIAGGTNWKQVAIAFRHCAAVKTDGTLWTWGYNGYGQLGSNNIADRSSPGQTVSGGTNWKQVACGETHTAAIKTDGTLWSWGDNSYGRLGDGGTVNRSSPVQTIAGGTNWKQVTAGSRQGAAIKTDGTLWLWGYNASGEMGDTTITTRTSPVQTVAGGTTWKQIACAGSSSAAIKTDGTLWVWGGNYYGQLGDGSVANKLSPVQTISGGTNWKSITANGWAVIHMTAIKTDGTLWAWGNNYYGQVGDGTRVHKSSPVQTVAGGTNWKQVAHGNLHTAAIKTDGTLWTWGRNTDGQLGDGTRVHKSSPVQTIAGGTNWRQVSAGYGTTSATKFES